MSNQAFIENAKTLKLGVIADMFSKDQSNPSVAKMSYVDRNNLYMTAQISHNRRIEFERRLKQSKIENVSARVENIDFDEALNCFTQSRGDIDMIVMISGHYNFFQRLFFRPKVMELSFHTKIPLYVLHHKE